MRVSLWNPTTDPVLLKLLGKLNEEVCELGSASSRCVIQGLDEAEPITGKINRTWLMEEIADVLACIKACTSRLELDQNFISERVNRKLAYHEPWYDHES